MDWVHCRIGRCGGELASSGNARAGEQYNLELCHACGGCKFDLCGQCERASLSINGCRGTVGEAARRVWGDPGTGLAPWMNVRESLGSQEGLRLGRVDKSWESER